MTVVLSAASQCSLSLSYGVSMQGGSQYNCDTQTPGALSPYIYLYPNWIMCHSNHLCSTLHMQCVNE